MKINNILIITVLFMSITITISGIYFYPLYYPQLYTWAYLSLLTSILNHMTPKHYTIQKWFQHIDRIIIRITACYYIFMVTKLNKDDLFTIEKYGKIIGSDVIIYGCIFTGAFLYIASRTIKKKKPHIPANIMKLPHACSHILASCATMLLFYEYSV
jgi:small-conductance mechanosensitive channel